MKRCSVALLISNFFNEVFNYNIVMFMASDLGYNDVSWNNKIVSTPNIDELTKSGKLIN